MDRDIDLSFERIREDDDEVFGMSKQSKRRSRRDDKDEKEEEEDFEEVETSTERWIPEDAAISVSNSPLTLIPRHSSTTNTRIGTATLLSRSSKRIFERKKTNAGQIGRHQRFLQRSSSRGVGTETSTGRNCRASTSS